MDQYPLMRNAADAKRRAGTAAERLRPAFVDRD
jgi:hypothetical protein